MSKSGTRGDNSCLLIHGTRVNLRLTTVIPTVSSKDPFVEREHDRSESGVYDRRKVDLWNACKSKAGNRNTARR